MGLRGSGKTVLARHILSSTESHIVYDPLAEDDYANFRRYVPENRTSAEELNTFVETVVIPHKPDLFVLDEASLYLPTKPASLPPAMRELTDLSRHWGISFGCIARRPTQIHTDILELSHYLFIFTLHGENDIKKLNSLHRGMGDLVNTLPPHHFVVSEGGYRYYVHAPVIYPPLTMDSLS